VQFIPENFAFVKTELAVKKKRLLKKIPGFAGYDSHHCLEMDWLLRKYLDGELERVRDRLTNIMINREYPDPLKEKFSFSLKTLAYLKAELKPEEIREGLAPGFSPEDEEQILDADFFLLEKVEGLNTPLDLIEVAGQPNRIEGALDLFDEGLAEVDDLFQLRRRMFEEKIRA
jgi:hypothetical protein